MASEELTETLAEIREEFLELEEHDRLLLLLDFANELPPLPERYEGHPDLLERVVECQSPVFLTVEVADDEVTVIATAPEEAPTTRGFASILCQGISGLSTQEALSVPDDFPRMLGLDRAVSPLRLGGMGGMIGRTKRQIREKTASA